MKLTNILNSILRLNYFPSSWTHAHVIQIPKPGKDLTFPQNYRPISLLSSISKIAEKTILTRLNDEIIKSEKIPHEQFGFREGHDTTMQLTRVTEKITKNFNNKNMTGMICFDIEKAFDKVWHPGLIAKLCKAKINFRLINLISSFLKNRTFQVKLNDVLSNKRICRAGVPQGAVLSPTLFNIFTHDIPKHPKTELALFADDAAIITTSKSTKLLANNLQNHTDLLLEYDSKWGIKINPAKTQAIIFTKKHHTHPETQVKIDNIPINWKNTVKYLGLTLDSKLTFKKHLIETSKKGRGLLKQLYPLLNSNTMNLTNKRLLYTSLIRPAITYGSPCWSIATRTNLKHIEVIQNKTLRMITKAPWFVRNTILQNDLNIPPLPDFTNKLNTDFNNRMNESLNPLINDTTDYDKNTRFRYKRPLQMCAAPSQADE